MHTHEALLCFKYLCKNHDDAPPLNVCTIGSHIRFEAKSAGKAMEWVEKIRLAINEEQERERLRVSRSS